MTRFFVALSLVLALTASAMPAHREGLNRELERLLDSTDSDLDNMNPGRFELSPEAPSEDSYPHTFVNPPPEDPVDEFAMPTPSEAAPSSSAVLQPTPSESAPATEFTPTAEHAPREPVPAEEPAPREPAPEEEPSPNTPTDRLMGMFQKLPVLGPLVGALGGAGRGLPGGL